MLDLSPGPGILTTGSVQMLYKRLTRFIPNGKWLRKVISFNGTPGWPLYVQKDNIWPYMTIWWGVWKPSSFRWQLIVDKSTWLLSRCTKVSKPAKHMQHHATWLVYFYFLHWFCRWALCSGQNDLVGLKKKTTAYLDLLRLWNIKHVTLW